MRVVLDREEWELCDLVEAEVGLFQAAETDKRASLHLCDLIVEEKELLQPPQTLEVVLLHHLQLVGRQVKEPQTRGVVKHPTTQGAELVVGHLEIFHSWHLGEAPWTQPGDVVVAKVEGDRE